MLLYVRILDYYLRILNISIHTICTQQNVHSMYSNVKKAY